MSVDKRAHEQLSRWVEHDQRLVNYREIAREFRVNINAAKRIIADHFKAHPSLFPTYLLTGQYLPTVSTYSDNPPSTTSSPDHSMDVDEEDDKKHDIVNGMANGGGYPVKDDPQMLRSGMILVGGKEETEAKIPLFVPSSLNVQLYSLSPSRIKDPAQYLLPLLRLRRYPNYCDAETYGTIRGGFEMLKADSKPGPSKSIPSAYVKPSASTFAASSSKTRPVVKEEKPAAGSSNSKEGGKDVDKTAETPKVKEEKAEPKSKVKQRVVTSDDDEEEAVLGPSTQTTARVKQPLMKMDSTEADRMAMEAMMDMSDDFKPSSPMQGGDADAGLSSLTAKKPAETSSTAKSRIKRSSEAAENAGCSANEGMPKNPGGRVRKKRRTVKQVAPTDAKGYMVFEDVSGEESYSSDDTGDVKPVVIKAARGKKSVGTASKPNSRPSSEDRDTKPDVKPVMKSGSKAPAVKKPGQQSLSSFFKKT